jgi:hypothetical protein
MSKEVEKVIQEIVKYDINNISKIDLQIIKDIVDLKNGIKSIEKKIDSIDTTLEKLFEILSTISFFMEEAEEQSENYDDNDEEDWTPYDERNFSYEEDDDNWGSYEDES